VVEAPTLEALVAQIAPVEANPTPQARRRFAASSIPATLDRYGIFGFSMMGLVGISMMGILGISMLGWPVTEQATQLLSDSEASPFSRALALQPRTESDQAAAQANSAQVKQAVEAAAPQARDPPEKEPRSEVLENELAEARGAINGLNLQLEAAAANAAQLLGQERDKATTLLQDASAARQELAASIVQHHQALDEERARSATLASELAAARREIETQAESLRKAGDETVQLKQADESAMEELRQSLQQERDRTLAMARDIESARRVIDERATLEPVTDSQSAKVTQPVEAAAPDQSAAAVSQGGPEVARLMARAMALLGQGNIGAARTVLERAAETGNAKASFALAETYDPGILSAWGAYGTRGDAAKAREFYAKAGAGGIPEAKDRFNALR
jgi:hypothetical protein